MDEKIFNLDLQQLKDIVFDFRKKLENGLEKDNTEIACLPTFIQPKKGKVNGKSVVLDLGGTNYRVATVDINENGAVIHPENGWKKDLSVMKSPGFSEDDLFKEMADPIYETKRDGEMPIGYCFSYPAESLKDGDAKLLRWTKGVNINEMVDKPVGKPLLDYLNKGTDPKFSNIKIINDTVASLFAGLTKPGYDTYIGLIVGTGTNLAAMMRPDKIKKLKPSDEVDMNALIPINLESGNFFPPHLINIDNIVDEHSDKKGAQRFEKAVSGMYLGEILKASFPLNKFEDKFDAQKLTSMMSYPDVYKEEYVRVARQIYHRSAALVAASLAGLISVLHDHDNSIRKIMLTAEGSLFWSSDKNGPDYKELVTEKLATLLKELGLGDIQVDVNQMPNANLIGTAIAALS